MKSTNVSKYFSFVSADILSCVYLVWQNFIPRYFNLYHKYMEWVTARRTRCCYDTTCEVRLQNEHWNAPDLNFKVIKFNLQRAELQKNIIQCQ